jgi:shikimate dehydrogenase
MTRIQAGLIGSGIQASRTPAMQMAEGRAHGLDYRYVLFDTDTMAADPGLLERLVRDAESQGFSGLNITHPYKQAVMALLDHLSDDAQVLGAVNTVVFRDGQRFGHNTDWSGFSENLTRGLPRADLGRVVQLGAGGGGAAVAYAILKRGAERLAVFDTDAARADDLVARLGVVFGPGRIARGEDLAAAVATADGLVNCTPVGMAKYPGTPLPTALLHPRLWVADIVYFPLETQLLRDARALGCQVVDGGGMAVFQAVEAFRLITGFEPDTARMLNGFRRMVAA